MNVSELCGKLACFQIRKCENLLDVSVNTYTVKSPSFAGTSSFQTQQFDIPSEAGTMRSLHRQV